MDSIADNYASSDSEIDSDEKKSSLGSSSETLLARLPAEIAEKYSLYPSIPKTSSMSLRGANKGVQYWSTFLYYEWRPSRQERMQLMKIVENFNSYCRESKSPLTKQLYFEPLHVSSLGAPLALHVSLSQTINFESEADRDTLFKSLQAKVRGSTELNPFMIIFQPILRVLPSYAKDSLFLILPVDPGIKNREMTPINKIIREALTETFPQKRAEEIQKLSCMPPSTHLSIAMATNAPRSALDNLNILNTLIPEEQINDKIEFPVNSLKFDKNRQVLSIPLGS